MAAYPQGGNSAGQLERGWRTRDHVQEKWQCSCLSGRDNRTMMLPLGPGTRVCHFSTGSTTIWASPPASSFSSNVDLPAAMLPSIAICRAGGGAAARRGGGGGGTQRGSGRRRGGLGRSRVTATALEMVRRAGMHRAAAAAFREARVGTGRPGVLYSDGRGEVTLRIRAGGRWGPRASGARPRWRRQDATTYRVAALASIRAGHGVGVQHR